MQEIPKQDRTDVTRSTLLWYLIVLTASGLLYAFTCAPTVLWQDSGIFIYRIWNNNIEGSLGLALSHPLYIMLGQIAKFIPFGELAYKINLISAISAAAAVANLFLLLKLLTGKNLPALIGASSLAVSWTFWRHAVIAETYCLFAAQMLAELVLLLQYTKTKKLKYLYFLGLFNGLTIANHMLGVIGLACYGIFLIILLTKKQITVRNFLTFILMWIIGALPYEYLIIKNFVLTGDILGTLSSAAFGILWKKDVLQTTISKKIILEDIIFILYSFPTLNFILFFFGLWAMLKAKTDKSFTSIVIAMLALYFLFAFRYTVADRYAFFIPFYCLVAFAIGTGADVTLKKYGNKLFYLLMLFVLTAIPVYYVTPDIAKKYYKALAQRRQRPYRDEYRYFLQPWKQNDRGAERFAREVLQTVEENAVIYAYGTDVTTILYVQEIQGVRPDVRVVSEYYSSKNAPALTEDTIERLMENSAVYVVSPFPGYCPQFLLEQYKFKQVGILWKVVE